MSLERRTGPVITQRGPHGTISAVIPTSSFQARREGNQAITTGTSTKIQYSVEKFDTSDDYDSVTNYRHTPQIAGTYHYTTMIVLATPADQTIIRCSIAKNSVVQENAQILASGTSDSQGPTCVFALEMNGSSDFVEGFVFHTSGSDRNVESGSFNGHLILES